MDNTSNMILTILTILGGGAGLSSIVVAVLARKKSKVEAAKVATDSAIAILEQYRVDNRELREECVGLRNKVDELEERIDEQDTCQTTLRGQIANLQEEKGKLMEEVVKLKKRVADLEEENCRLKEEKKGKVKNA